ncbi:sulfatase family protein [Pedobacter psychrophilus]|nr:sulfatase [Pedobacter psychrophilus]
MLSPILSLAQQTRPNVVIVMADDLDTRQLSCYGGKNLQTTNIDALAKEGMLFNDIYCSEAICIPTRASLFTGVYPARHGSYQNHKSVYPYFKSSVNQYLNNLGYKVGLTGKDHSTKPKSTFPFDIIKGFEENCVSKTDDYFLDSIKNYITKDDKPFCLFVMSINPHAPWTVGDPSKFNPEKLVLPPNWVDTKESRVEFCKYLAEVRRLDDQVGDITKLLKETGKDKNTVVIFLGEQGPQFPGGKWNSWNYGQKSSMIVRWPGTVKPMTTSNAIVQYEDITPTLIDIAGGKVIDSLDGNSFLKVIKQENKTHRDYAYGIYNNIPEGKAYPMRSIRDNDFKMILNLNSKDDYFLKYVMNPNGIVWASWTEKAKTSPEAQVLTNRIIKRPAVQFYDMKKDPYELNNLADDSKYQAKIKDFKIKLAAWMKEQGDSGAAMDVEFGKQAKSKKEEGD